MDPIAWGQFPGAGDEENPTCEASERAGAGDDIGARELLMEALGTDLRCLGGKFTLLCGMFPTADDAQWWLDVSTRGI